jgi:glycine cleavage system transcriptional repressor
MRSSIVFTLTGKDRTGIVEEVTGVLLELGGNVETSRMVRLGGEFAVLMLVSLPGSQLADLGLAVEDLSVRGYRVTASETVPAYAETRTGWSPYQVEVHGADHEGIIHEIAHGLSQRGINIESMETETTQAPISGTPLFAMTALVAVPPGLAGPDWISELTEAGHQTNVDIKVSVVDKRSGG